MPPSRRSARSAAGLLFRSFTTFVVAVVVGGLAVGACLAALIPGTVDVVTAHHYTGGSVKNLRSLSQQSTVYWNDGVTPMECGELGIEIRHRVSSFTEVPPRIVNAVLAAEDRTFWTNDGIDLGAVFRAFVTNVVSGEIVQGGSTITQQLVKKRILSDTRDVNRKLKEIIYALRLNEKFSKDKILTEYLNTVYFGENSYGIKSAAERFFVVLDPSSPFGFRGKKMEELTIGEAALLAGSISNPVGNDPFLHPERAKVRRGEILEAQVAEGYITRAEADAANLEPLPVFPPPVELRPCNYLVAEVRDRLLADTRLGATPDERRDTLLRGGLKIITTFDQRLQFLAQEATDYAKPQRGPDWISSLVSIEPSTGAVRAMIGGPDFGDSQYNIATHPIGRQPGSTWKVITLAAALANGYSPNDRVNGSSPCRVPKIFPAPDAFTVNAGDGAGGGPMPIWDATSGSVNCAYVRLSTSVGLPKVIDMAHRLGIQQTRPAPDDQFLTLSIGVIEATPLEMATVMATISNNGVRHTPYVVAKIVFPDGKVIDNTTDPGVQVITRDEANCEVNILRRTVTGGTGTRAALASHTAWGKTGTTDNDADAWFLGATAQLATAVWFGNRTGNVSGAGYGGVSSAPVFKAFMDPALEGQPDFGLPPAGPVCARAGLFVDENGGRTQAPPPTPTLAPPPPSVQVRPPTPTSPPVTLPPATTPPAPPGPPADNQP